MYRLTAIAILTVVFFIVEFVLFNILPGWLKPDILLIIVVFFNLYLGIRYSLATAFWAGLLKDSLSLQVFGLNIVAFLFCAYMTTFVKRYLNYIGSPSSRILIIFLVSVINVVAHYLLISIFSNVNFYQAAIHVMLPEIVMTTLAAGYVFQILRKCVRYFHI